MRGREITVIQRSLGVIAYRLSNSLVKFRSCALINPFALRRRVFCAVSKGYLIYLNSFCLPFETAQKTRLLRANGFIKAHERNFTSELLNLYAMTPKLRSASVKYSQITTAAHQPFYFAVLNVGALNPTQSSMNLPHK